MIITKDRRFYKELFGAAAPLIIKNLSAFMITLADSAMLGRAGMVSEAYPGAMAFTVLGMMILGIESGCAAICSQCRGSEDTERARKTAAMAIISVIAVSLIFTAFCAILPKVWIRILGAKGGEGYLRLYAISFIPFSISGAIGSALQGYGAPSAAMVSGISALAIKLSANYLLIFGKLGFAKMGLNGAAISSITARTVELIIMLAYAFCFDKRLELRPRSLLRTSRKVAKNFLRTAAPLTGGQGIWIFNTLFAAALMAKSGTGSTVTALAIVNTLNAATYIIPNGLSASLGIIIGREVGSENLEKIKEYSYTSEAIFLILGAATAIIILLIKSPYLSLYAISEDALKEAGRLIGVLAITVTGTAYQSACLSGLIKSGGDPSFIFKNDAAFLFLAVIPLSLATARLGAPPHLIFLALKSDQILKCLPAAIRINRFRWIKRL